MATIEKLKSGRFRIRKMLKGRYYSLIVDKKPSARQAERMIEDYIASHVPDSAVEDITFAKAASRYIESVEGVLSQSTIKEYVRLSNYIESHYGAFSRLSVRIITKVDVQAVISDYASGKDEAARQRITKRSAKTVTNLHGFIAAVLSVYRPDENFSVRLPARQKKEPYIPSDGEVKAVVEALRGSEYEVPVMLCAMGLRRSEVCALTAEDLEGTTLHIHKALVQDKDRKWVIKDHGKTPASTRDIEIPQYVADLIRERGYVYRGYPGRISQALGEVQAKLGIPHFSAHKLRHYYASAAIALSVPIPYVERAGGWSKGSPILRSIYIHAQEDKQKEIDRITVDHMGDIFSQG
jgi:integrase